MTEEPHYLLEQLAKFDTATVCNAIELLEIRDRTDGFMGFDIRCLSPELGPMVGFAVPAPAGSSQRP